MSSKRNGKPPNDIKQGFYSSPREFDEQRETQNYASMIKLIMMRFGQSPTDCFDSITQSGNNYYIVMKDGDSIKISRDEIELAGKAAKFSGNDSGMIKDANFIFTAYVKRYQQNHDDPVIRASFEAALHSALTSGGHEKRILEDLGMVAFMNIAVAHEIAEGNAPAYMYNHGVVFDKESLPYDGWGYILS